MRRALVLLSGGIDSTTLLHYVKKTLRREVYAISFNYGQRHSRELEMAKWQAKEVGVVEHRIVDISFLKDLAVSALLDEKAQLPSWEEAQQGTPSTYVPNRNMILLSIAISYAESRRIPEIYYGAQRQDYSGYWDTRPEFIEAMNRVLKLNPDFQIQIIAPFVNYRKADIVRLGLKLGVNYEMTWSCYRGGDEPCGVCPSCVDREKAFKEVGLHVK